MGRIVDGVYIPTGKAARPDVNSQHGEYSKDRQREDHAQEIIQPFLHGQPNPEFAAAYPDRASDYFSSDQLNNM